MPNSFETHFWLLPFRKHIFRHWSHFRCSLWIFIVLHHVVVAQLAPIHPCRIIINFNVPYISFKYSFWAGMHGWISEAWVPDITWWFVDYGIMYLGRAIGKSCLRRRQPVLRPGLLLKSCQVDSLTQLTSWFLIQGSSSSWSPWSYHSTSSRLRSWKTVFEVFLLGFGLRITSTKIMIKKTKFNYEKKS